MAIEAAVRSGASHGAASPAAGMTGRQAVVLVALTFVYVLNFLDRQLLGILAKPIQDTLHVTDGQLGLIGGLYFAMFYCFIAIPVGWLADRTNRVGVLALACGIWSAATIACGLSATYPQLVAARMTVGFGEAGGVPPSYAIITDTFPPERRGFAFGIYNLGPPIGAAVGVAFGGAIAVMFDWRHAFVAIGLVGVIAAIVVRLIVREPVRGATDPVRVAGADTRAPFWPTVAAFFRDPVLVLVALAGGATQFVTYGLGNFAVLFLIREKNMTMSQIAIWYALVLAIGMSASMLVAGRLIDRLTRRARSAYATAPALSLVVAAPFYLLFVWVPAWPAALLLLLVVMLFNYFYLPASVALVQEQVRPNQRVFGGALLLLVMNFLGLGLGPTYVGWASDHFAAGGVAHPLPVALYTLAPVYLVAIGLFVLLARVLRASPHPFRGDQA